MDTRQTPDTLTVTVRYEEWSLNSRGNGTVTYRRYGPSGGSPQWANEVGEVVSRERGGTFRAGERNATSRATITFHVGARREVITVRYRGGQKVGSDREQYHLHGWPDGKLDWRTEPVPVATEAK